jgi:23S rRNA (guanosine2251-2'-O)-methyltransferase
MTWVIFAATPSAKGPAGIFDRPPRLGSRRGAVYTAAMKPPHSNRHGGSGRPPNDRGASQRPAGQGQPGDRHQQSGQSQRHGDQPQEQRGPRPPGKPFQARPNPQGQNRDHDRGQRKNFQRPDRQQDHGPRHTPDVPRGAVWLYGLHSVAAALANPGRRLRRLLLTEEAQQTLLQRLPPPWPLQPEQVDRGRIDHLLGRDIAHQGAALLADPLGTPSLQQALERPGPLVVLDQVTDPRNVGAILRSAAAFGVAAVITQDRNAPEENGALAKAASGALETIPLLRAVNIARTLIALKAAGIWVVGLDAGGGALSGPSLADRRIALVLGAEGEGLRRLTRETCDEIAGLAMKGAMESLNVSAAGAVALYELTRRA